MGSALKKKAKGSDVSTYKDIGNESKGKSGHKKDVIEDAVTRNPADINLLYEALQLADQQRKDENVADAILTLKVAFGMAVKELPRVDPNLYDEVKILLEIMKECQNHWSSEDVKFNPPYRRLRHINRNTNSEESREAKVADQKMVEQRSVAEKENIENVKKKTTSLQEKSKNKRPSFLDKDVSPIKPLCKPCAPLFPYKKSNKTEYTSILSLYTSLKRGDALRKDKKVEEAAKLVNRSVTEAFSHIETISMKDYKRIMPLLNELLISALQWKQGYSDFAPNYKNLKKLKLPKLDEKNDFKPIPNRK